MSYKWPMARNARTKKNSYSSAIIPKWLIDMALKYQLKLYCMGVVKFSCSEPGDFRWTRNAWLWPTIRIWKQRLFTCILKCAVYFKHNCQRSAMTTLNITCFISVLRGSVVYVQQLYCKRYCCGRWSLFMIKRSHTMMSQLASNI